jgi:small subunit ribosomal protein S6
MRSYETTFILAPTLEAEGVQREIDSVKKVITEQGGEITAEKEWGRRRLAYPIQDHSEGVYHVLRFTLKGREGLAVLARHFRLNDNVLRHLVIRDEGTPLDYVGQVSESEEHHDRHDRRDRPGGRPGPRRSGPADRDAPPRSASASSTAGGEKKRETTEATPAAAGKEESSG